MDNQEDILVKPHKKKGIMRALLSFFFSVKGCLGCLDYLGIICIFNLLLEQVMKWDNRAADMFAYMVFFCASIAAVQKRCRDIGIKGTFFIIIFSILLPIVFYLKYARMHNIAFPDHWKAGSGLVILVLLLCHFFLLSVSGKPDKNIKLISPLLKYPYIYMGICFIVYFIGFYLLMQYKGI